MSMSSYMIMVDPLPSSQLDDISEADLRRLLSVCPPSMNGKLLWRLFALQHKRDMERMLHEPGELHQPEEEPGELHQPEVTDDGMNNQTGTSRWPASVGVPASGAQREEAERLGTSSEKPPTGTTEKPFKTGTTERALETRGCRALETRLIDDLMGNDPRCMNRARGGGGVSKDDPQHYYLYVAWAEKPLLFSNPNRPCLS